MKERLEVIVKNAEEEIKKTVSEYELANAKSKFLGKKSEIVGLLKKISTLDKELRPEFAKSLNFAKKTVLEFIENQKQFLKDKEYQNSIKKEQVDIFMPGRKRNLGTLHPIRKVWREIENVFLEMGFDIVEGFDVEDEFHNFDALNTPKFHPARDLSDTFYIENDILLRTQTSTVQVRVMENYEPPIRIVSPGRCYRNDNDASHSPAFHQIEVLVVDEKADFVKMRDMMNIFVKKVFGEGTNSRIRPHFFPFTEPSAEIDIVCVKCQGKGCSLCKDSGWIELGGAGMVDPNVLDVVNIDSEKFTGYAIGMGLDRVAMLKYNIPDMRILFQNDVRFLKQFD